MNNDKPLVLMIEDNPDVLRLNKKWLTEAGFDVSSAETIDAARKILKYESPDIIILDILLPDGNGLKFLPELKTICGAPVLFCSSRSEDKDIVHGLEAGGDDYIPKPYNVEVLVARVKIIWRKEQENRKKIREAPITNAAGFIIIKEALKLDLLAGRAYGKNGEDLQLSQREFALLLIFTQNENRFVNGEYLYEEVWKTPMANDNNALKSTIKRLRAKINESGYQITWSRGQGYGFEKG